MKTILALLLLAISIYVVARRPPQRSDLLKIKEPFQISARNNRSLFSDQGIVNGVRLCGGDGKYLQWRYESCKSPSNVCVVPANKYYRGELTFVPSGNSSTLALHAYVRESHPNGTVPVHSQYQSPGLPESFVGVGKRYALTAKTKYSSELRGKLVNVGVTLTRPTDEVVEICASADFYVE